MSISPLAWAAIAATALTFAGCSSTETRDGSGGAQVVEGGSGGSGASTSGLGAGGAWNGSPLNDPDSLLATRKIYFDFDRSEIRPEFLSILNAHADYMLSNRSVNVTIEGHGDERGSREYNIGLGERRASAVKNYLEAAGVAPAQINVVSYGEERPQNPGHSESAWALNRRAVLVY